MSNKFEYVTLWLEVKRVEKTPESELTDVTTVAIALEAWHRYDYA